MILYNIKRTRNVRIQAHVMCVCIDFFIKAYI
jgi:hypothetical protein